MITTKWRVTLSSGAILEEGQIPGDKSQWLNLADRCHRTGEKISVLVFSTPKQVFQIPLAKRYVVGGRLTIKQGGEQENLKGVGIANDTDDVYFMYFSDDGIVYEYKKVPSEYMIEGIL